ncbi:NAD(P)-binding protein [Zopfia rhizophila CBS 207.26]|uniref:NAD(P)-binding protein n=1 Tax=Zopfia rhizophila CBS 207.26 TaxID=1314779 RepID=A0A6A6E6Z5_9PEZI|nr:NAD(P)-binding protein [Zopfia rhizophila CBS 207.26]
MALKNVALIGASGTLGPSILKALQSSNFDVSILNRSSSKSKYSITHVITVPDDLNVPALTALFKENSIDALVISIAGSYVEEQKRLIQAAFNAGVKRVIPAEFGSCDSADDATVQLLPLMEGKKRVRGFLEELSAKDREGGNLTWTSLVTGHFFDHGLSTGLLKLNIKGRKAYLQDGGNIKFSGTNLDTIGTAVAKVLQPENEEKTKNKLLYIHSFSVTQNEILDVLEQVTGQKWERVYEDSKKQIGEARPKMLEGDDDAREEVVSVWGIVASDWRKKEGFANQLIGLQKESLEEVVKRVVQNVK